MQACEAMVSKCGSEISCHIPGIVSLCLEYITYDPNYNYDDGEDSDMECDDEGEEEGSDDEYSDDDDVSWKVRRAAAKCLEAVITTRHEMMEQFYTTISPALINRYVMPNFYNGFKSILLGSRSVRRMSRRIFSTRTRPS